MTKDVIDIKEEVFKKIRDHHSRKGASISDIRKALEEDNQFPKEDGNPPGTLWNAALIIRARFNLYTCWYVGGWSPIQYNETTWIGGEIEAWQANLAHPACYRIFYFV